jgi:hypothetical protein
MDFLKKNPVSKIGRGISAGRLAPLRAAATMQWVDSA